MTDNKFFAHSVIRLSDWCDVIEPVIEPRELTLRKMTNDLINEIHDCFVFKPDGYVAVWWEDGGIREEEISFAYNEEIHLIERSTSVFYACKVKPEKLNMFDNINEFKTFIRFINLQFHYWKIFYMSKCEINLYNTPIHDVPMKRNGEIDFDEMNLMIQHMPKTFLYSLAESGRRELKRPMNIFDESLIINNEELNE